MFDVNFVTAAVIRGSNLVPDYSAQDFETQPIGSVMPFTYDFQSGFVTLGYDFITVSPVLFNDFDSQDMESFAIGVITSIPGTITPTTSTPVVLLTGTITPLASLGDDDLESYAIGVITQVNQSISMGDITMQVGSIRSFP